MNNPRFLAALWLGLLAAAGLARAEVPANPWLAQGAYPVSHHNAGQTDSTPVNGPDVGAKLKVDQVSSVPLLWSSAPTFKQVGGETIIVAANPGGIVKVRGTGEDFTRVSNVPYPGMEDVFEATSDERLQETLDSIDEKRRNKQDLRLLLNSLWMFYKFDVSLSTFPNGAYSVIDKDGYHYTNFNRHSLVKSFDNNRADEPMVPVKHANIVEQLAPEDAEQVTYILGITMTYDGHIVAAAGGAVILVDRDLNVVGERRFLGLFTSQAESTETSCRRRSSSNWRSSSERLSRRRPM